MTEAPGDYRTTEPQKYENPPITTTEGLEHGSGSSIYLYHEHHFNSVAASHALWALALPSSLPSPRQLITTKTNQQTEVQQAGELSQAWQRRISQRIRSHKKPQENSQAEYCTNIKKIENLEETNGVGAL